MKRLMLTALATLLTASPVLAQVTVADPWVRGTVAQQRATGAFMKLTSTDGARLVEARSPVAGVVEIHEMTMDNNVMRMRRVDAIDVAAGGATQLRPGGLHVMLMELRQPLRAGEQLQLTLRFERAGTVQVAVPIQPASAANAPDAAGHPRH